jgi:hypothetical protein
VTLARYPDTSATALSHGTRRGIGEPRYPAWQGITRAESPLAIPSKLRLGGCLLCLDAGGHFTSTRRDQAQARFAALAAVIEFADSAARSDQPPRPLVPTMLARDLTATGQQAVTGFDETAPTATLIAAGPGLR